MMRHLYSPTPAIVLLALLGLTSPLAAQMYPGEDVTVNPNAVPGGPALLQPGQPYPGIVLKRPWAHHRHLHKTVVKTEAPAGTANVDQTPPAASADANTPPATNTASAAPAKARHHGHAAATANMATSNTAAPTANPIPFTFGGDTSMPPPAAAPTAKIAKAESPPAHTPDATKGGPLAKRGAILFLHDSTDPTPAQLEPIKMLAGDLKSAIDAGATGIQLQAYGGAPGDKSSDARRISLKRGLAIRQLLIDNGVPADRIDVRAMGGATDKGEPDRVDVFVRAS